MNAIFKMNLDCGRSGNLYGIFTAEKDDVKNLIASKKEVYFGEVLGKHSEVSAFLNPDEIEMISDDPAIVEMFQKLNMKCGYNPFNYIEEDEE